MKTKLQEMTSVKEKYVRTKKKHWEKEIAGAFDLAIIKH